MIASLRLLAPCAAALALLSGAASPEPASEAEQSAFNAANKYLKEQSFTRSCDAFVAFESKYPKSERLREARTKRARACLRAGQEANKQIATLREVADGKTDDLSRALANIALFEWGDEYTFRDSSGRMSAALKVLEGLLGSASGGGEPKEIRDLFFYAGFQQLEAAGYSPQAEALAKRLLAAQPSAHQRDRVLYLRARTQLHEDNKRAAAEKDLLAVSNGGSEWADDALFELAAGCENRSEYVKALGHFDALVKRFNPSTSNRRSDAEYRARAIREPVLNLGVSYFELPGSKPEATVSFRNLNKVSLSLRRADPFNQEAREIFQGGTLGRAGKRGEVVKTWSETLEAAPYAPGSKTFRFDVPGPGIYLLEATAGEEREEVMVGVTSMASVIKTWPGGAYVWTVDALTGAAVPGAQVALYLYESDGEQYRRLEGKADAEGLCRFSVPDQRVYRAASWSGRDGSWAFADSYFNYYSYSQELLAYVLADRPLYKPGEKVGFKLYLRSREAGPTTPVADAEVSVLVYDPQGREALKKAVKTSAFGTAFAELQLPKDAALGAWRFYVSSSSVSISQQSGGFRVEEYKPPEYVVKVEPVGKPTPEAPAKAKVTASFYFGGPVADAQGRAVITETSWAHHWAPWPDDALGNDAPGYHGYPYGYDEDDYFERPRYRGRGYRPSWRPPVTKTVTFKTGADGTAEIELAPSKEISGDRSYSIQVFVTDASRREVTGAGTVVASSTSWFVDVRPDRVLYKPGERVRVKLRAEDANGRPESGPVEVRLVRLGEKGQTATIARQPAQIVQGAAEVVLDADALGAVRVEARSHGSAEDAPALASADLWLTNEAKPMEPPDRSFRIITDRAPLKAGGTVRALIVAPTAGGHVLVGVEGEKVHHLLSLPLRGRARFVELPLTPDMAPNAFLTAGRVEQLRYFATQAPVKIAGGHEPLEVRVEVPRPVAEPGTQLPVKVALSGKSLGKAEVSLSVVDEAIFAIEKQPDDPLSFFTRRPQYLRVSTSTSFNQYTIRPPASRSSEDRRQPLALADDDRKLSREEEAPAAPAASAAPSPQRAGAALDMAAERSAPAPEAKAKKASAGPGLGEEDSTTGQAAAPVKVRSDFSSSAGWFPALPASAQAPATASARFSDSLTSWKLIAVAVTDGPAMGVGEAGVRTEKPLMVRLQAPRFFTERDEVTLSAVVNSRLPQAADVSVEFDAPGLKPLGPASTKLRVEAGREARVDTRWAVVQPGDRRVRVTARSAAASDAMEWTLPAVVHGSAQRQSFAGGLGDKVELEVSLPQLRNPSGTRFELTATPTTVAVMLDALPYLASYPYGCVEQTLSRFVPAAIAAQAVNKLGLSSSRVPADLDDMVASGLKRLYGFQHGDGGWGWWKDDPTNRWMSAYALYGLSLGRDAGLAVDAQVLSRGRAYVLNALGAALDNPEEHAFMVFALARTGEVPKLALDKAFQRRTQLSKRGRALLALALQAAKDPRARIAVENLDDIIKVSEKWGEASVGTDWDYWDTSEAMEATAYTLMAIYRHDPKSPKVQKLLDFLVTRRQGGKWRTTRDTAFAVYALADIAMREEVGNSSGSLVVMVNGKQAGAIRYSKGGSESSGPVVLSDAAFQPGKNKVEIRRDGRGTGWYAATWDVYNQDENVKGVGGDVTLSRRYTILGRPGGEKVASEMEYGMALESGERVRVDLEIESRKPLEYVMVEDLKPAGLEAVLQQSGQQVCGWRCTHAELRTDRVAMFMTWLPKGKTVFSYELRAEVPGRFHGLPARFEAMYAPEVKATSDEVRLEVRDPQVPGAGVAGSQ